MRLSAILLICALGAAAQAAPARELKPADEARLREGQVLVELEPSGRGDRVWAAEEIDAPPETVWAVMTDCAEALRYVPRLQACDVLDADPAGRWDVRRHEIATLPLFPRVKTTFRLDYDRPRQMSFRQVAGDMAGSAGDWRLIPLDGGARTCVIYEARLTPPSGAPRPLARAVLRHDAPAALEGLRRLSLERAREGTQARAGADAGAPRR